ncbi:ParB/RepB/Spo0J family partition protein [Caldovatus aquaticus]|uniref:ParB/RepB/Spo0J family partition protein n=1 Tax=Caldovatus aquaticus TaxID=2865671 RepID=A0ABS7EYZ3_9PROT|nr:ParB/RepB/Spo0J family partition protein [Caldovatus aquaticus]MBW8268303.1 ParB/RepB/Spo0J family partition protein [Caldovatus aquaticus]
MIRSIPTLEIEPDPENVRVWGASKEADDQLLASVRALGVLQPLIVRPAPRTMTGEPRLDAENNPILWRVVAGNRRLTAARIAGLQTVPCDVREELAEGEATAIQLAENTVRSDMTPVDVWLAVNRLAKEGWQPEAIGLAFNLTAHRVRQLIQMAQLPEPIVQWIREQGDVPEVRYLRVICQAEPDKVLAVWKQKGPRKGERSAQWWSIAQALEVKRIPYEHAIFEMTEEAKAEAGWARDLFDPADHPGYFHDVIAFRRLQLAAIEAKLATVAKLGVETTTLTDASAHPPGCTWESRPIGAAKSMKKAERGEWVAVGKILWDGRADLALYRKKPTKKAGDGAPATAEAGAGGKVNTRTTGRTDGRDAEAGMLTEKGMHLVEVAKREAVKAGLVGLGSHDLLLIALLLLRHKLGVTTPAMNRLLVGGDGAIDCNSEDRIERINAAAVELLGWAIGQATTNRYAETDVPLALVERIGMGLAVEPRLTLNREGLDQLKRDALEAVRTARSLPGFNTQKELKNHIVRMLGTKEGMVTLTPADLPVLACSAAIRLPYRWQADISAADDGCGKAAGRESCECGWIAGNDEAQNPCADEVDGWENDDEAVDEAA